MKAALNIQSSLQEYMEKSGAVGAAVGLINNGSLQFLFHGNVSAQKDAPITEDTIFEIGSITKVFTTLILMDMVYEKKVYLDQPIDIFLPGIKIPEKDGKKITFRHLATHTSGLPTIPDNLRPKNPMNPFADYSTEDLYTFLKNYSLPRVPSEQFEYSNVGMGLLGHLLCKRANKSYDELVMSRVCKRLEMKNTAVNLTDDMKTSFAQGHRLKEPMESWDIPTLTGAGALHSDIKDMVLFLCANMGLYQSSIVNLLKDCHKPQHTLTPSQEVGLGWMITSENGAPTISHNGGTYGFKSYLGFKPDLQRGVVILSNSSEEWPDEFGTFLLDSYLKD